MITHNKNGLFGSRITAVFGKNGAYVVSTAKQGIFQGLSTWFYESANPPFGNTEWIYKLIYSDSLNKNQRLELHDKIVNQIELLIDGEVEISLTYELNNYLNELVTSGLIKDIIDSYSELDFS